MSSCQKCHSRSAVRIHAQIQNLAAFLEIRCLILQTRSDFLGACAESFSLRDAGNEVSLRTFAAPTILRPARFKKRGGRANRRRCARWRRSPSDCRVEPHYQSEDRGFVSKFLRRGFVSRSLQTREIRDWSPASATEVKHVAGLKQTG